MPCAHVQCPVVRARLRLVVAWLTCCGACGSSVGAQEGDGAQSPPAAAEEPSSLSRPRSNAPVIAAPSPTDLRILTFNINFGVGGDPANVAAVAEADADVVLLQETTDAAEQAFRGALADTYPHVLFRQCCRAGGLGLMSKYPIVDETYLEPNVSWFPAWRVVLDTPLGHIQTLNVHLRPPMSDGGSWVSGYFSTRGVRREEIEDFWNAMDSTTTTIVAGDFNENAGGQAVEWLADKGLVSALPQVSPHAKTWRWQTRMGKLRAQLDHVVYGPGLALRSAEVLDRGNSDHFPVLVVLGADLNRATVR